MFELDTRLANDTYFVCDLPLCSVLLANDSQFPWLILVPRRPSATELYLLDPADQQQYLKESAQVCNVLEQLFSPAKLNVAALGNVVSQLHIHHVARFTEDCAWPAPIWGRQASIPYPPKQAHDLIDRVTSLLIQQELNP
ncbi:HIT domain-containing protein [Salinimonas sediminis]|uniref:HIT domain-containing protein n=1 Tax=Salinimonas sediminis TaxID=2303538 RepID=A0A346NKU4_9ALTE|nr:HIT domain-containing protein [Salinimonas sediminis]AXR06151.1 HIT domain-containing protein [Salinimonas sediminis]